MLIDYLLLLASLCVWIPLYMLLRDLWQHRPKRKRKEKRKREIRVYPGGVIYPLDGGGVYTWQSEDERRHWFAVKKAMEEFDQRRAVSPEEYLLMLELFENARLLEWARQDLTDADR